MILKGLRLPPGYTEEMLLDLVRKKAGRVAGGIRTVGFLKLSIDARKKEDVHYLCDVLVNEPHPLAVERAENGRFRRFPANPVNEPVVIAGAGPAGLFAALKLLESGVPVTVLERGEPVEDRVKTVERYFRDGILDPESNVSFGEGGAGTFSDGKLNTGTKSPYHEEVFRTFYVCGAGPEILYDFHPHVGTDVLRNVVRNLREKILALGGTVRFSSKLTDIRPREKGVAVGINGKETLNASALILAIGHSARDTFELLRARGFRMEQKPFALGVRIEHPAKDISFAQYGRFAELLPPASYKLTGKGTEDRGVYSFCMCPGGFVVNSSSEEGGMVVNGMSDRARDGVNSNAAIVVQVRTSDFQGEDVLAGVEFQKRYERLAFGRGQGRIPVTTFGTFVSGVDRDFGRILPSAKGRVERTMFNGILPDFVATSLKTAIPAFGKQIKGFDDPDAVLSAVESRTSSPVRILRDETLESSVPYVFPAGEGAGYAGGIVSSAADGLRVADAVLKKLCGAS